MTVSARYWRLVGAQPAGKQWLALAGLQWFNASGTRVDQLAMLTCSVDPVAGAVGGLQSGAEVVWAAEVVRSPGFELRWTFDEPVFFNSLRLKAVSPEKWIAAGLLQYSADGRVWVSDVDSSGFVYPGDAAWTPEGAQIRLDTPTQWDAGSKAASATISGKSAKVVGPGSRVRTAPARSTGRRVFALKLKSISAPQMFFAGVALLSTWGAWNVGRVWLAYAYDGRINAYLNGSGGPIPGLSPGAVSVPGDTIYFDVDLDAGSLSVKKNAGTWSAHVALPNFIQGESYVITNYTPSTGGGFVELEALTTESELGALNIREGAIPWDSLDSGGLLAIPPATGLPTMGSIGVGEAQDGACALSSEDAYAADVEFGGSGTIHGTVELFNQAGNLPLPRRVRLHRSRDGLLVRETWSDAQGNYRFDGITDRYKYDAIAWDHEGLQQSVVANDLTPEVMP